jgi:hypothetical protein
MSNQNKKSQAPNLFEPTCYFHDKRSAVTKCEKCGKKICSDCKKISSEGKKELVVCINCCFDPKASSNKDLLWIFPIKIIAVLIFIISFLADS